MAQPTGRIEQQTIAQVRDAVDIVEIVSDYVKLKRTGRNYVGLCPFHNEKTPSFSVSSEKQLFKCFGCGVGGSVFTFVQQVEGIGFADAVALLAQRAGIRIEHRQSAGPSTDRRAAVAEALEWAQKWYVKHFWDARTGSAAQQYIENRGFEEHLVRSFGVGYAPDDWQALTVPGEKLFGMQALLDAGLTLMSDNGRPYDRFRGRVMFPIHDVSGRVLGFGGRVLDDSTPKYLNSPETALFSKGRCLFGLHKAASEIRSTQQVAIVEGYTDCMMAHQAGVTHVVATLGTALTDDHVQRLRRLAKVLILVFDTDSAGQQAADRALELCLAKAVDVRVVTLSGQKDPCDYILSAGEENFRADLRQAIDGLEFKWRQVVHKYHASDSVPQRQEALDEFFTVLANASQAQAIDPIRRGLILNHVAKLVHITADQAHQQLQRATRRLTRRSRTTRDANDSSYAASEGERLSRGDSADMQTKGTAAYSAADTLSAVAAREVLEVVLNRPDLWVDLDGQVGPDDFPPGPLRSLGHAIWALAELNDQFTVADVLDRCEDVQLASMAANLHEAGHRRQNFEVTLRDAVQALLEARRHGQHDSPAEPESDQIDLAELQQRLKKHNPRNPGPVLR